MSTPPVPPGQPPAGPPPPPGYGPPPPSGPPGGWMSPPPPPRKPRPRKMWWFVAAGLLVLAPLVFAGALFTVLRPLAQEDAVFSSREGEVQLGLPAGEERAVFSDSSRSVRCEAVDGGGQPLPMRPVSGDFTLNEWTAVFRFDTGDGDVTLRCRSALEEERFRVAQLPSTGGFIAGIVVGIIGPLVLGAAGVIMLIVMTVLWTTRAPRRGPGG